MNNGVRLESQSWGADHAPEIDYTGASMVEVVKGAECVRYGFGAMGGVVLLNEAPLPYGNDKLQVHGKANLGYDTNARGGSGSGSLELGYRNVGLRLHGMYTKGGDYRTAEYILNNTGYNTISLSGVLGYKSRRIEVDLSSSLYYQRSGIYYASKISDLDQLIKRFEYGRPDPSTLHPFSYDIKPPLPAVPALHPQGRVQVEHQRSPQAHPHGFLPGEPPTGVREPQEGRVELGAYAGPYPQDLQGRRPVECQVEAMEHVHRRRYGQYLPDQLQLPRHEAACLRPQLRRSDDGGLCPTPSTV